MCGGYCNIPQDEIDLYLDKQMLPLHLGPLVFSKEFEAGKVTLRYDFHRGGDYGDIIWITLWYRGDLIAFYDTPNNIKSGARLQRDLRERLKATEQDIAPVVALWEKEIVPLIEAIKKS